MSNTKASTLAERFGFSDPELSTPEHDALMVWLDGYIDTWILQFASGVERAYAAEGSYAARKQTEERPAAEWEADRPMALRLELHKQWEEPITTGGKYTVGFVDMAVRASWTVVNGMAVWNPLLRTWKVEHDCRRRVAFFFEVKPSIRSVGETIRQIRLYQEHQYDAAWYVVSPDDRFVGILAAQGIGFLKAPNS